MHLCIFFLFENKYKLHFRDFPQLIYDLKLLGPIVISLWNKAEEKKYKK